MSDEQLDMLLIAIITAGQKTTPTIATDAELRDAITAARRVLALLREQTETK